MEVLTTPTIGRLLGYSRIWAYFRAQAGDFGLPVGHRGRTPFYAPAAVEHHIGRQFSPEQLRAVGLTGVTTMEPVE